MLFAVCAESITRAVQRPVFAVWMFASVVVEPVCVAEESTVDNLFAVWFRFVIVGLIAIIVIVIIGIIDFVC